MTKQTLKTGTCIQMRNRIAEMATIGRWTKVNGPVKNHVHGMSGWHVVRFADGGELVVHEDCFSVFD